MTSTHVFCATTLSVWQLASNYRPISLTSVPCKVMEGIIRERHLLQNDLLSDEQHGFLPNRSVTTNLLEAIDFLTRAMDDGEPIDVIFTDFAKAFDTVAHRRLLLKLHAYSFEGDLLIWIASWLTGRKQRVKIGENTSEWKDVTSGVPQGSVLGPLLLVLFINDLPELMMTSRIKLYADDSKILAVVKNDEDAAALQADIDRLTDWSDTWLLRLNIEKCKVMHVHGRGKGTLKQSMHTYTMLSVDDGARRQLVETVLERDLGVLVTPNLKWKDQVEASVAKANRVFGMLKRTFASRSAKLWKGLYTGYIRPHLEFATQVWSPQLIGDIAALEGVQRRVTKYIAGLTRVPYTTADADTEEKRARLPSRLDRLELTTLEARRLRGDLIQQFKITHGLDHVSVQQQKARVGLRDAHDHCLVAPSVKSITQRQHSFACRVVDSWNALPQCVVAAESVNGFKIAYDGLGKGERSTSSPTPPGFS